MTVVIAGVSCTFGAGTGIDIGTLTGGINATADVNAVVKKTAGSFLCPSTSVWTAEYTITNHSAVYVEPE